MQVIRVDTFFRHPQWNGNIYDGHDIALARLQREAKNVTCPSLPNRERVFMPNTIVQALGWGFYDHHGAFDAKLPDKLQMANELKIVDPKWCPGPIKKYLNPHLLCAYSCHMNVCYGKWTQERWMTISLFISCSHNVFSCLLGD